MITQKENKIIIKADAPKKFKREITILLNQLMKDYLIESYSASNKEGFTKSFKDTFKSNLYYIIDNYYDVKPTKKLKQNHKWILSANKNYVQSRWLVK